MKNLKKVLLALVVVAMLVSSIVTVAIANESEPEYTGSVEEAQKLYDDAIAKVGLAGQSEALVAFYAYIDANPIDPAAEGYVQLIDAYNVFTFTVAQGLYDAYDEAKSTETLAAVYTHVASAPSLDAEVEVNEIVYTDFVKLVNKASLEYADSLVDALFTKASGSVSYYEYLAAQQALTKFFDEAKTLEYIEAKANEKIYTGNLASIQAMLKKIKTNSTFEDVKVYLADVYTYLRATPVNPATDGFAEFLAGYNAQCKALAEAFDVKVDGAQTVAEQVQMLKDMRAYLAATPLSEAVVEAFNTKLASVVEEYNTFAGNFEPNAENGVADLGEDLANIPEVTLGTDLTELTNLITALEAIVEEPEGPTEPVQPEGPGGSNESEEPEMPYIYNKLDAFVDVYEYLAENDIEPATAGYAELIVRYNAQADLVVDLLEAGITETTDLNEKLKGISLYYQFLSHCPVNEEAINEYNTLKADVVKLMNDFSKALKKLVLPTYTPADVPYVSTDVNKLNYMRSGITGELENQKVAMSAMYTYLLAVEINTEEDGYDVFVEAYDAKRNELTTALLATIDAAETPEAKLAAFQAVKEYLVATPYSYDAVVAFNEKVAAAYPGDDGKETRESLTIGNEYIYFALAEVLDFFLNFEGEEEPTIDEILAAIETVYAYSLRNYDVTDTVYYIYDESDPESTKTFSESIDEVFDMMGKALVYYAKDGALNTDIEKVSLVCEFFKKVPFSETAINSFNDMISLEDDPATQDETEMGYVQEFVYVAKMIDENLPNITYIYNDLNTLISNFNRAEGLDNRIEAFKALYNAKAEAEDTLLTSVSAAYATFSDDYKAVCENMAAEIIASINVDANVKLSVQLASFEKAHDFLVNYEFSQTAVDGYNAKIDTVTDIDFAAIANSINTDCPVLVYESPETAEADFEALNGYIAAATDEAGLVAAYKYFAGNYNGAKAFDFAKKGFAEIVESFDEAKKAISDKYTNAVKEAEFDAKPAALYAMYAFVKQNCISSNMVDAYTAAFNEVGNAYVAAYNATYNPYSELVADIHTHLKKCPVDLSLLTEAELAIYDDMQLKIDALEYGEVYGQILGFKTATGDDKYVFIIQKQKVDAITGYIKTYEVTENYTEYAFSNSLFALAAEDFVKLYVELVEMSAGDDEVKKAQAAAELKYFIENEMFCKTMADLYNAYFASGEGDEKIEYNEEEYLPDEATGTLAKLSELMNAYMGCVLQDNDIDTYFEEKTVALMNLFAYLEENPLDPTSPLDTLMEDINDAKDEIADLTELQKQKADAQTPESEYELNAGMVEWNFENGKFPSLSNPINIGMNSIVTETLPDGTENKYWLIETVGDGAFWNIPMVDTTIGTVFEFDIMFPIGAEPMQIDLRPTGTAVSSSGTYMFNRFIDGKFTKFEKYDPNHPDGVEIKISEGAWTHIIVVLNPVTFKMTLYVDYVKIGEVDIRYEYSPYNYINPERLRLPFETANTSVAFDNFQFYAGTSYRQHGKFDGMTEGDKFKYYVDFFSEDEYEPVSRAVAYNKAVALVETYRGQEEYKDYVQKYDSFDYDSIFSAAEKAQKLAELVKMMNESGADNVNSETYVDVREELPLIEEYMVEYSYYLDQSTFEYNNVKAKIATAYAEIARVEQLLELVDALKFFNKATTVAGMTRRAAEVTVQYEKCNFAEIDNYVKASNDPAIIAFLATVGEDITLDMFYNGVMAQRIAERTTYENAGKIVTSVKRLEALVENADGLSEDAYLAAVMEAAKDNLDYANAYMMVIRNTIKADNYDKTYAGLDEAIEVFDYLDTYFYQLVVEDQLEVIQAQLERYPLTNSYIDKVGICTYVEMYISENSVDVKDPLIAPYYTMLLAFEEELKTYEAEYKSLLNANTTAFIGLVDRMSAFVEYKDIKPLYDEALNNYYYNMNLDSDAAKAAMATFEAYEAIIKAAEENSKLFVEAAKKLSTATKTSAIYKALVECAAYVDSVDESIEGVADALAVYNAKLSAYNAKANPVNTQISETASVVCSVRTVSVNATVLATIKKIINK